MLLACCFRDRSKKKHKKNKNWKNENVRDNEESYEPSKMLISSPKISSIHQVEPYSSAITTNIKNISTFKKPQDTQKQKFLPEKLLKFEREREELKIHRRSCAIDFISDISTPYKKDSNIQIISPTSTNISTIQYLEGNQLIHRYVSRMFASAEDLEGSLLSVSSGHQSLQISNESLVSSSKPSLAYISVTSLLTTKQDSSKDETITLTNYSTSEKELSNSIEKQDKGKPIEIEQIKENVNKTEEVIKDIREESANSIQSLKIQNQIELEKLKESYAAKLLEEKENHMKNVEKENIDAKNEANETISKLTTKLIQERGKTFAEQQDNSNHLDEKFVMKNEELNTSLKEIEQKEKAWQDEKADVLKEVQRMKAEATRMVKIVAMDYEGEPCDKEKSRSLIQEVYSLQLVVEIRSGELRNLRDQLARATQQLEQEEIVKEKLKKASARMEDLEEQLKIKKEREKQLIDEKIQLEKSLENTSNNADRISQNMEALHWRIRNNFDLPVDNLQPVTCEQPYLQHPSFLVDEQRPYTDDDKSKSSFSCEGVPAKVDDDMHDDQMKNDIMTSLSCSHMFGSTRVLQERNSSETEQRLGDAESTNNDDCQVNSWNDDGESLDEGVGDISSECEHGSNDQFGDHNDDDNNKSDKSDGQLSERDLEAPMDKCNSCNSPERERISSIF